jgi:hypothetical protein
LLDPLVLVKLSLDFAMTVEGLPSLALRQRAT